MRAEGNQRTEPNASAAHVKVFLSKKETDWERASRIKGLLDHIGSDRLSIFMSQDITAGDDWRKRLEQELAASNVLILLFSEPSNLTGLSRFMSF